MKKSLLFVLSLFFAVSIVFAQGIPPSFQADLAQPQVYNAVLQQNIAALRAESLERERFGQPMRIAIGITTDLELNNENAPLIRLASGEQIRRQAVYSAGAYGLILTFGELFIPEGGVLFVYTENREQIEMFTHETNPYGGAFATGILHQSKIVLEYVESTVSNELPRIHIINVGYVYRSQAELRNTAICFINVNCSEGDDWQAQAQGVVGLWMHLPSHSGRNWYVCSGSLINNVRQDGTPFILTASHCIANADELAFETMRFDFFKESVSDDCFDSSQTSPLTRTRQGAELIAYTPLDESSDGALLKLVSPIPADWRVFFNGWDASGVPASSGVSIHHPFGMVKKISTFNHLPLVSAGPVPFNTGMVGENTVWRVIWSRTENGHSVTYFGSSGAPIFNQNGHIVGTLVGGGSFCHNIITLFTPDFYGKFSYHWNQHSDTRRHFSRFLDPDNTGTLVLDGFDPHAFSSQTPTAIEASNVTGTGFTANWEELPDAAGYFLNVFQRKIDENDDTVIIYVFEKLDVGNVLSYTVEGLEYNTLYFYTVVASDGTYFSRISNEIEVTTSKNETSTDEITAAASQVFICGENIIVYSVSSVDLSIYTIAGHRLFSRQVSKGVTALPAADFASGVYIVRVGADVHKIVVR